MSTRRPLGYWGRTLRTSWRWRLGKLSRKRRRRVGSGDRAVLLLLVLGVVGMLRLLLLGAIWRIWVLAVS